MLRLGDPKEEVKKLKVLADLLSGPGQGHGVFIKWNSGEEAADCAINLARTEHAHAMKRFKEQHKLRKNLTTPITVFDPASVDVSMFAAADEKLPDGTATFFGSWAIVPTVKINQARAGVLPEVTKTDACHNMGAGTETHTVDLSPNRNIFSQVSTSSFDNETIDTATFHYGSRVKALGSAANNSRCRDIKDGSKALWGASKSESPKSKNFLCTVHGQTTVQGKCGVPQSRLYSSAAKATPGTAVARLRARYVRLARYYQQSVPVY